MTLILSMNPFLDPEGDPPLSPYQPVWESERCTKTCLSNSAPPCSSEDEFTQGRNAWDDPLVLASHEPKWFVIKHAVLLRGGCSSISGLSIVLHGTFPAFCSLVVPPNFMLNTSPLSCCHSKVFLHSWRLKPHSGMFIALLWLWGMSDSKLITVPLFIPEINKKTKQQPKRKKTIKIQPFLTVFATGNLNTVKSLLFLYLI